MTKDSINAAPSDPNFVTTEGTFHLPNCRVLVDGVGTTITENKDKQTVQIDVTSNPSPGGLPETPLSLAHGGTGLDLNDKSLQLLGYYGTTNARVEVAAASVFDISDQMTISLWVSFDTYPTIVMGSDSIGVLLDKQGTSGSNYTVYQTADGKIGFRQTGTVPVTLVGSTIIPLCEWTRIRVVIDATNVTLYINGIQDGQTTIGSGIDSGSGTLTIGNTTIDLGIAATQNFDGRLEDIRIYNAAVSADDDFVHLTAYPSNLIAYYPCQDGSGSTLTDAINANNGTITGGAQASFTFGQNVENTPNGATLANVQSTWNGAGKRVQVGANYTVIPGGNQFLVVDSPATITLPASAESTGTRITILNESGSVVNLITTDPADYILGGAWINNGEIGVLEPGKDSFADQFWLMSVSLIFSHPYFADEGGYNGGYNQLQFPNLIGSPLVVTLPEPDNHYNGAEIPIINWAGGAPRNEPFTVQVAGIGNKINQQDSITVTLGSNEYFVAKLLGAYSSGGPVWHGRVVNSNLPAIGTVGIPLLLSAKNEDGTALAITSSSGKYKLSCGGDGTGNVLLKSNTSTNGVGAGDKIQLATIVPTNYVQGAANITFKIKLGIFDNGGTFDHKTCTLDVYKINGDGSASTIAVTNQTQTIPTPDAAYHELDFPITGSSISAGDILIMFFSTSFQQDSAVVTSQINICQAWVDYLLTH